MPLCRYLLQYSVHRLNLRERLTVSAGGYKEHT